MTTSGDLDLDNLKFGPGASEMYTAFIDFERRVYERARLLAKDQAPEFNLIPLQNLVREAFRMGLNVVPDVDCKHSEPQPSKNDNEIDRLRRGFERILYSTDAEMLDGDLARDIARKMLRVHRTSRKCSDLGAV